MKTTPGPKELATRALGEAKIAHRKHTRTKRSLIPYAGKPPGTSNEHLYGNTPGPKPPKGGQRKKPK